MDKTDIYKRNLLALSSTNPELAARLSADNREYHLDFILSKTNQQVPAPRVNGHPLPLHSRFDPIKEGLRFLDSCLNAGYVVFLGLGGGYHIRPFLKADHILNILIIEKNLSMVRAILKRIDMRDILMDMRVLVLIDADLDVLERILISHYRPALVGNLKTVVLQSRVKSERAYFEQAVQTIKTVISRIADDYTVQSQFGKKWFINTLANLSKAEKSTQILRPVRRVFVTGAGPSLEDQIGEIKKIRKTGFLIASDTSLPCLLAFDIKPDLVLSIDCQQVSYNHFLAGFPLDIPLVLDLASPPVLTDLTERNIFFSSDHPFSQYVTTHWRRFPKIDTSGGNVSHAALSLAELLGAEEILLFGIDFSFPEGKSYARGTYIYPYFRILEKRTLPLETHLFSFLLRNENIFKERIGDTIRYTTKPMISYKDRLENSIRDIKAHIVQADGKGVPLSIRKYEKPGSRTRRTEFILSQGASKTGWKDFLNYYLKSLKELPDPGRPFGEYWGNLATDEIALWLTQLPAATALRKGPDNDSLDAIDILKLTRDWTISILQRYV